MKTNSITITYLSKVSFASLNGSDKEVDNINPIKTTGGIPYSEVGVGIGNILNILSLDAIWRISQFNNEQAYTRFGIYTTLSIVF